MGRPARGLGWMSRGWDALPTVWVGVPGLGRPAGWLGWVSWGWVSLGWVSEGGLEGLG